MVYTIFDIEANGLLKEATEIWCLSYRTYNNLDLINFGSTTSYSDMKTLLRRTEIVVGHNMVQYDVALLERILDIKFEGTIIDTLAISFYHYPVKKFKHGLEDWGVRLGTPKVKIDKSEWAGPLEGETKEQFLTKMIRRCEGDVEINSKLFHGQVDYTMEIYEDFEQMLRLFAYLSFKMDCLKEQEEVGITLDIELAEKSKAEVGLVIDEKMKALAAQMPKVVLKTQPKVMYKKDGEVSVHGLKWFNLLEELGLPEESETIYELGNPGSPSQIVSWLFGLGWIPETFKVSKSTGLKLPQVSLPFGAGLCPSVKRMFEEYPYLEDLNGLFKAKHRFGLFKSFLENVDEEGRIHATAFGFTNTLRMQHTKPCVNLPGVDKWYGKEIRGCLKVSNENYIMCGCDVSGLEDNTKQHYIYFYDPQYVIEMRVPGFDPHIDIAVLAGLLTKDDEVFFKHYNDLEDKNKEAERQNLEPVYIFSVDEKGRFKVIKVIRGQAKTINFSATYGAGPPKIAEALKCSLEFATILHETYWKRNWAVKKTAKDCIVKTIRGQKWLYNPVSGFWMFLKADKDKFSTLNQSSGVYFFDTWVKAVRQRLKPYGIKICFQTHDEILMYFKKELKDEIHILVENAMVEANEECALNVELKCSVDVGLNYAACH